MSYLRDSTILINLIVMAVLWLVWSFDYFLSNYQLKYLPGNVNVNTFASYATELVSYMVSGWFYSKFSLKQNIIGFYGLSFVFGMATLLYGLKHPNWSLVLFICMMRFGMSAGSNICYIGTPTLFPTLFASTALGFVNVLARLLTAVAPYVNEIEEPIPMLIYCVIAGVGVVTAFFVRDTNSKNES